MKTVIPQDFWDNGFLNTFILYKLFHLLISIRKILLNRQENDLIWHCHPVLSYIYNFNSLISSEVRLKSIDYEIYTEQTRKQPNTNLVKRDYT